MKVCVSASSQGQGLCRIEVGVLGARAKQIGQFGMKSGSWSPRSSICPWRSIGPRRSVLAWGSRITLVSLGSGGLALGIGLSASRLGGLLLGRGASDGLATHRDPPVSRGDCGVLALPGPSAVHDVAEQLLLVAVLDALDAVLEGFTALVHASKVGSGGREMKVIGETD